MFCLKSSSSSLNILASFCIFIILSNQISFISSLNSTATEAIYGTNMSQIITQNQNGPTMMTNTSLINQSSSSNNNNNNKSSSITNSSFNNLNQQTNNNNNNSKTNYNNYQSIKGNLVNNNNYRQQASQTTNSPAFNSRLKTPPSATLNNSNNSNRQDNNMGKKLNDNQMAADNIHETQAFMTINSASTTVNSPTSSTNSNSNEIQNQMMLKTPSATSSGSSSSTLTSTTTTGTGNISNNQREKVSTMNTRQETSTVNNNNNNNNNRQQLNKMVNTNSQAGIENPSSIIMMINSNGALEREQQQQHLMNSRQANQKSNAQQQQASSSIQSSSTASGKGKTSYNPLQQLSSDNADQQHHRAWRPPSTPKEVPKFLQYQYMDNLSHRQQQQYLQQQRYLAELAAQQLEEQQQQQQQQQQPIAQLEKPNGYSYDQVAPSQSQSTATTSTSYTHTSPISPVKQEVLLAEQLRRKQQQQNSIGHSIFGLSTAAAAVADQQQQLQLQRSLSAPFVSQQIEQSTISGKSSNTANVLPQFNQQQLLIDSNNLYSPSTTSNQHNLKPPVSNHHGGSSSSSFSMMQGPHLTITGTAANPCKPSTSLLSSGLTASNSADLGQSTIQIMSNNDNLLNSNQALALPNFSSLLNVKYTKVGDGIRLRSGLIFKVIRADSLTDCELACTRSSNLQDICKSFNYRAYFAAENCELSRHDWRNLKLDDSSQFEQHTQFDFYSLLSNNNNNNDQQQPAMTSAALMMMSTSNNINSIQQQQLNSVFPEADCLDVSQSCTQDGMEFTLRTNEPFNGRIYTYGFYDSCFTDGDGSTNSVLRISRSNGFPRCGTQQIGDLMTNIVVVQFNDYVQTTRDKKYNLTCYFSGPGEAVVTSNYLDTKIDERSHPIQIEHLPPQNVITSNVHLRVLYRGQPTNTIAVGDLLTFRLETRHNNNNHVGRAQLQADNNNNNNNNNNQQQQQQQQQHLSQSEIFATNVIAKDPYSGKQVQLIDSRGCPIDPINVFPELQRTPDGALESEFYAFKIPDSNFLIFQATVRTCKAPCEPVICQSPSIQNNNNNHHLSLPTSNNAGIKGSSYTMMAPLHSAALLQQQHNSHILSVPSWGRKRRQVLQENYFDDDDNSDGIPNYRKLSTLETEMDLNLGESVEHIIPVKMKQFKGEEFTSDENNLVRTGKQMQQNIVTTIKRPELAEAEEEVKEMFRVYLSRAEINQRNKERQNQQQQVVDVNNERQFNIGSNKINNDSNFIKEQSVPVNDEINIHNNYNNSINEQLVRNLEIQNLHQKVNDSTAELIINNSAATTEVITATTICMTQSGYYVLMVTIISLTLVMLFIIVVSLYISKKAKFNVSDSIASTATIHF